MPTVTELETIVVRLEGDVKDLINKLKTTDKKLTETGKIAQDTVGNVKNSIVAFGSGIGVVAASLTGLAGGFTDVSKRAVKLAADAESLRVSFEVMTGSAQTADRTIRGLYKFAAETPFGVSEVVGAGKQMLAYGEKADDLVPTLKRLGDVAAGVDKPLNEIVYTYGSIRSQGTAYTQDIREFAGRGIPIYLNLAKALKLVDKNAKDMSEAQMVKMRKMVEEGKVTFDTVGEAFKLMSGEGGLFFNMLEKKSKTLSGMFANMTDDVDAALRDIGVSIAKELHLKEAMAGVSNFAQQFRNLSPEVKSTIMTIAGLTAGTVALTAAVIAGKVAWSAFTAVMTTYITKATLATGATLALKGAALGIGAYLGYEFAQAVLGVETFNKEVERSNKILDARGSNVDKGFAKQIEDSKMILNIDERRKFLSDKILDTQKQMAEAGKNLETSEAKMNKLIKDNALTIEGFDKDRPWRLSHPKDAAEINEAIERTNHYAVTLARLKAGMEELRKEQGFADKDPGGALGNVKALSEAVTKLRTDIAEMGMEEFDKIVRKGRKEGLNKSQLDILEAYRAPFNARKDQLAQIEKEKKERDELVGEIESTSKALMEEYSTRKDMSHFEKAQALRKRAIDSNYLFPKASITAMKDLETLAKLVDMQDKDNKLKEEAKKIIEEVKTPLQHYTEQRALLNQLFSRELLTTDQYTLAMDAAEKKFKDATNAANGLRQALEAIDAVMTNSAEGIHRVNVYKEMLRLGKMVNNTREWSFPAPIPREKNYAPSPRMIDTWTAPSPKASLPAPLRDVLRDFDIKEKLLKPLEEFNNLSVPPRIELESKPGWNQFNPADQYKRQPMGSPQTTTAKRDSDDIVKLLTQIAVNTLIQAQKEGAVIAPANLDE